MLKGRMLNFNGRYAARTQCRTGPTLWMMFYRICNMNVDYSDGHAATAEDLCILESFVTERRLTYVVYIY